MKFNAFFILLMVKKQWRGTRTDIERDVGNTTSIEAKEKNDIVTIDRIRNGSKERWGCNQDREVCLFHCFSKLQ